MRGGTSNNNNNNNSHHHHHNTSSTIALPKSTAVNNSDGVQEVAGAQDTIYLCNFRVSVDGEWLCLKELQDLDIQEGGNISHNDDAGTIANFGIENGRGVSKGGGGVDYGGCRDNNKCDNTKIEREWVNYYSRDPAAIERSNLVNICKLVVKELLEQSLRFGRMLDSDHLPLQHFFIVLEHVLRNGLKPKKGLLGPRKELWDLLQSVEKYCIEAQDITASVRDLPTVKTQMGRARAWLRLALMQKKIADYLQALVEHKEDLAEYYEPHALMMSDEIVVIMGILVGLNVIDCNLCVKEEDLDSQQGIIDFSLYLRSSSRTSPEDDVHNNEGNGAMTAVLDQKNYIEELNRHLNATVANLQAKVEALTTTNALQKEDLAIARNNILALQAENMALRRNAVNVQNNHHQNQLHQQHQQQNHHQQHHAQHHDEMNVFERIDTELAESLAEERKKKQEIEKELELQISLKAETEMAMKLLEKDIHEKQDTIISLRRQLEDIKLINLEMYKKLQECESSLKHKTDILSKLESQKETMANAICDLEKKFESETSHSVALQDTSQALSLQVLACEERAALAEAELRIEREWRHCLQEKELKNKEEVTSLQSNIKQLHDDAKSHIKVKEEFDKLKHQWNEAQKTLEELGIQLSVSKLQISDLKEQVDHKTNSIDSTTGVTTGTGVVRGANSAGWTPDKMITKCKACSLEFTMTRRKHHCRQCGEIFCHSCSEMAMAIPNAETGQVGKPVRVCDSCFAKLAVLKQNTR